MKKKPPRYKKQRHPDEVVRLRLTVAEARSYSETCRMGGVVVLMMAAQMTDSFEQLRTAEVGRELLRLAHGFARRVEEG